MKLLTAAELEPGKFYQMGHFIIEFIKDTGKIDETYKGKFSGVYLCRVTAFSESAKRYCGRIDHEMEIIKNPHAPMFHEIKKEDIQEYIDTKERSIKEEQERIEFLKKFL